MAAATRRLGAARRHLQQGQSEAGPVAAAAAAATPSEAEATAAAAAGIVDLAFFRENGYVVVKQVVPPENVKAVLDEMQQFLGIDLANRDEWYEGGGAYGKTKYEIGAGMVEMYQSQAMWNNRQHPKLHQAFAEVFGTDRLNVSVDRVNMKPPERAGGTEAWGKGLGLHWDGARPKHAADTTLRVQGVLLLSDCKPDSGGFCCLPGLQKNFAEWAATVPEEYQDKNFGEQPSLAHLAASPLAVEADAGDLIIWNRLLPHGNGRNTSHTPRLAQFISMAPVPTAGGALAEAGKSTGETLQRRVDQWQKRLGNHRTMSGRAANDAAGSALRGVEEAEMPVAVLTELGEKLLGTRPWE